MNINELRRVVANEIAEGRELKRSDADIASRILDELEARRALNHGDVMVQG